MPQAPFGSQCVCVTRGVQILQGVVVGGGVRQFAPGTQVTIGAPCLSEINTGLGDAWTL